jgi:hypothetical protein
LDFSSLLPQLQTDLPRGASARPRGSLRRHTLPRSGQAHQRGRCRTGGGIKGTEPAEASKAIVPERVVRYFAAGIVRSDSGAVLTDISVELESADAAVAQAEHIAGSPGFLGAWAYCRTGFPEIGWYGDQEPIARFGCI